VARGYISGSGWKEYKSTGAVCGIRLPEGLVESQKLPAPIFTPATKAETGHDENVSFETMARAVGEPLAARLRDLTLELYTKAAQHAETKGILIADTKFEFGLGAGDEVIWIDEALTPDSSRYWDASTYRPGAAPPSYDKQFVRDYLDAQGWKHEPPAPVLPPDVVRGTSERYRECYRKLTGSELP
jgi:phosphoribosylaminoimidazole-succinocarboxamide synthase